MGLREFFLGDTYSVKCPDGSSLEVYRSIDKIFPLYARDLESSLSSRAAVEGQLDASVDAGVRSNISLAFASIDEMNSSTMMDLRAAYVSYKNNPCSNSEFYNREVVVIRETRSRLQALKIKLASVIHTLKSGGDAASAQVSLNEVLSDLRIRDVASQAAVQIEQARQIASEMSEVSDDG